MLIVQIAAHAALMPLRVENAVVAEGQPAGLDVDAVFDGESSVEHVYLHGSIAEYTPFHGESLEFAIEMYMAGGTSVEFGRDAAHIMMYELQVGTARFNLEIQ